MKETLSDKIEFFDQAIVDGEEVNANRLHWTKFFQSLLSEKYGYKYGNNQEVILNINIKEKCN